MRGRILALAATAVIMAAVVTGCGCGAKPIPTNTPPAGTVAGLPEETRTPTPTPTPSPTPSVTPTPPAPEPEETPTPTLTPEPTPTPTPTPSPTLSTPVTILSIIGSGVMVKRAGTDTWLDAEVEMTLQPGDSIKTSGSSKAEITFFDGSTVELEVLTEITVAELGISASGSTKVKLTQTLGKTISRVKKLVDTGSSFDIETPAAIAAVRGSVMIVTVASNGRTVVGNEHGDIRIIVSGIEYTISEGFQRTIAPGEPPSAEIPMTPLVVYSPPPQARLETAMQAAPAEAYVGEIIIYTCSLNNTGDLSFNQISANSSLSGNATYQSGDADVNNMLDPGETWLLTATYTVQPSDYPEVVATANISATTSTGVTLIATETATTPVIPVLITAPDDGATVNLRALSVSGIVLDAAFNTGTVSVNGGPAEPITIVEGSEGISFTGNVSLADGENTVTVTLSSGQQTASDSIIVNLIPYAIRIELTWSTGDGTDMDLHFIRPGSALYDPIGDCYYNLSNRNPDWGVIGDPADNPYFYVDDFAGFGPEIITLFNPYDAGEYKVTIVYNDDNGMGPSVATVRIYIYENLAVEPISKEMVVDEVWDCAIITWPPV